MNRNFSREDTQRPRSMRKDAHRQSSGTWRKAACLQDGGVIGRHPVGDSGGPDQFPAGGNATRAAALGAHLAPCAELNARPSRRGAPRACTQQTRVRTAAEAAASALLSARPEAAPRPHTSHGARLRGGDLPAEAPAPTKLRHSRRGGNARAVRPESGPEDAPRSPLRQVPGRPNRPMVAPFGVSTVGGRRRATGGADVLCPDGGLHWLGHT